MRDINSYNERQLSVWEKLATGEHTPTSGQVRIDYHFRGAGTRRGEDCSFDKKRSWKT